jgi:hypothetical protein
MNKDTEIFIEFRKLLNKIAFLCLLEFIFIVNLFKDAIMLMLKILKNSTLSLKYVLSKLNFIKDQQCYGFNNYRLLSH